MHSLLTSGVDMAFAGALPCSTWTPMIGTASSTKPSAALHHTHLMYLQVSFLFAGVLTELLAVLLCSHVHVCRSM